MGSGKAAGHDQFLVVGWNFHGFVKRNFPGTTAGALQLTTNVTASKGQPE
jgi:hypothetical protein